jgi:glycerol-3-phosphate O-acyltransferase/dihydroxyacetone phosphate acyltransferase
VGDKIRPPGTAAQFKIISIESDTAMHIDVASVEDEIIPEGSVSFDILPHVDLKICFEKVLDKLASGGAIGIFPEGGSHDRTDLLPLKVGIALIAYEAMARDGINIPIVPVGLNYHSRDRIRGGVVVEYGPPMYIDTSTLQDFTAGGAEKRRVCNELLDR